MTILSQKTILLLLISAFLMGCSSSSKDIPEIKETVCSSPTNFIADALTGDKVNISWTNTNSTTSFEIEYGKAGFNLGTGTKVNFSTSTGEINNLEVETEYQIYLRAKCGTEFSGWMDPLRITTPCDLGIFQGNVTLTTQSEVDEFGAQCYTGVNGWLKLIGDDGQEPITDLSSLDKLKTVTGLLSVVQNEQLTNLNGFESLNSVKSIAIYSNPNLESIEGLENLTYISGASGPILQMAGPGIDIKFNQRLKNLDGLEKIKTIGQLDLFDNASLVSLAGLANLETTLDGVFIGKNPMLSSLNGLGELTSVSTDVIIQDNSSIQNLEGLNGLENIGSQLDIRLNENLSSLTGLENLTNVESVLVFKNPSLSTLQGLRITGINDIFQIEDNDALIDLNGLEGTTSESYIIILENANLASVTGMNNVTELGGFDLFYNDQITSLTGLESLLKIQKDIRLGNNLALSDFCALSNLVNQGEIIGGYSAEDNLSNPSLNDIATGNCN